MIKEGLEEDKVKQRIIVVAALLVVASFFSAWAGPKLVLSEDNWEFGDVPNKGTVSHTFKLTNAGDALLRILSVTASCGCTTTKLENQEIKPGASTGITATFNSGNYPSGGRYVKTITVMTDDPMALTKTLSIGATVSASEYAWGGVTPRVIEVSDSSAKGKGGWQELLILNQTALTQKVTVLEKVGLVSEVKISGKTIPAGEKGLVRVKLGAYQDPLPPSSLTLQLGSRDGERRVSIPVAGGGMQPTRVR
jgi:hypothetical protein